MIRNSAINWAKAYVNENRPEQEEKYDRQAKNLLTKDECKLCKWGPLYHKVMEIVKRETNEEMEQGLEN